MKVAMPLAKNVLAPLGLSAAMSAILGASLLGDVLSKGFSGKGVIRAGYGSKRPSLKKF